MSQHHRETHRRAERVTISAPGKKSISFKKGALHEQLGVPQGQPIPPGKKQAALAGKYGPKAKKRAAFAFRGALAEGRQTASSHERRSMARAKAHGG